MTSTARWDRAAATRAPVAGYGNLHKTDYVFPATEAGVPYAYVVEQAPSSVIRPHFHVIQQFQLFTGGGGTFARRPIRPLFCHYAGPYTGYGPIQAGPDGVRYLTLRPRTPVPFSEQLAQYLPEQRVRRSRSGMTPRSAVGTADLPLDGAGAATTEVIARRGAASPRVSVLGVSPAADALVTTRSGPAFALVLQGVVRSDGAFLRAGDLSYLEKDETVRYTSGSTNATVIVCEFPGHSGAP